MQARQQDKEIRMEWKHHRVEHGLTLEHLETFPKGKCTSGRALRAAVAIESYQSRYLAEKGGWVRALQGAFAWWKIRLLCARLPLKTPCRKEACNGLIEELQVIYYLHKLRELQDSIARCAKLLEAHDLATESKHMVERSLNLLRATLAGKYNAVQWMYFDSYQRLYQERSYFCEQYPVVLSTTFSSRRTLFNDTLFDYVIIDEASRVSTETGVLALTRARNAVIVCDAMQLPNIVPITIRKILEEIWRKFKLDEGYDCSQFSFLDSVSQLVKGASSVLLREHYRCHPRIINYCNKRFYENQLLIMTEDKWEPNTLEVIKTVEGNHARENRNLREIDVIREEVLPMLGPGETVGIISPYRDQVNALQQAFPNMERDTVHKFQGREMDVIILSTVKNQVNEFVDNKYLINVAISRAKKRFYPIITGNSQERKGYLHDFIEYVRYQNYEVLESNVRSIYDCLYSQYKEMRLEAVSRSRGAPIRWLRILPCRCWMPF